VSCVLADETEVLLLFSIYLFCSEIRDVCYFIMSQFKENWALPRYRRLSPSLDPRSLARTLVLVLVASGTLSYVTLWRRHKSPCSTAHDLCAMCQNMRALVALLLPSVVQDPSILKHRSLELRVVRFRT